MIFSKGRCHTKRRMGAATRAHPSFGMTTTKTLMSVFSWHTSDEPVHCFLGVIQVYEVSKQTPDKLMWIDVEKIQAGLNHEPQKCVFKDLCCLPYSEIPLLTTGKLAIPHNLWRLQISDVQIQASRIRIQIHPFFHESESESTPFSLNPNPTQKATNPD